MKRLIILLSAIVLLTIIIYSPVFKAGFLFTQDDDEQITYNLNIRETSLKNTQAIFSGITLGMYQPLTTFTYALEYKLVKLEKPWLYHANNLILHLINILLVIYFTWLLWQNKKTALVTGLLFALWPTQVEPVAWLSARSTLLAACFMLSTLIFYFKFLESKKRKFYIASLITAVLALLSKSLAIALVPLLFCLEYKQAKINQQTIKRIIPLAIIAFIFGLIAIKARTIMFNASGSYPHNPLNLILLTGTAFTWQTYSLFWPFILKPLSQRLADVFEVMPFWIYITALSPILVSVLAYFFRKNKDIFFFISWFIFSIIFSIAVVPYTYQTGSDRYNYLACLALIWPLVIYGDKFIKSNKLKILILFFITSIFSFATFSYSHAWQNDLSLWEYSVKKAPGSAPAWNNLAIARQQAGDNLGALVATENGLNFSPNQYELLLNRGYIKLNLVNKYPKIIADAQKDLLLAETKKPNNAIPKYYLGLSYLMQKDYKQANKKFDEALLYAQTEDLKNSILANKNLATPNQKNK